jgi:hypothetical protein
VPQVEREDRVHPAADTAACSCPRNGPTPTSSTRSPPSTAPSLQTP